MCGKGSLYRSLLRRVTCPRPVCLPVRMGRSAESKQELTATRKKLVAQGVLKVRSRLDVVDVAKAALQEQKQRDASDWAVRYKQFCERFKDSVTESSWFKNAVTIAIFVAGINVGAQTYDLPPGTLSVFETLDDIVLSIFVAECILNIFAEGLQPWRCVVGRQGLPAGCDASAGGTVVTLTGVLSGQVLLGWVEHIRFPGCRRLLLAVRVWPNRHSAPHAPAAAAEAGSWTRLANTRMLQRHCNGRTP